MTRHPVIFACPIADKEKEVGIESYRKFDFPHHQSWIFYWLLLVLKKSFLWRV